MDPLVIAAAWLLLAVAAAGWAAFAPSRTSRTRLWSLLARKPYTTRRAYAIRMLVYAIESTAMLAPVATVMVGVPLSLFYLEAEIPESITAVVIIATMVGTLATCVILDARIARRAGLTCPACKKQLGDPPRRPGRFLLTGRCAVCDFVVFPVPLSVWNPQAEQDE